MKKYIVFLLITILCFSNSYGQHSLWNKTSEPKLGSLLKMDRASIPRKYELYSLNLSNFKMQLQNAPIDLQSSTSNVIIPFPNPNGELEDFRIFESPIMETGLSDKFPDSKTYVGKGITDPTATIRFSVTLFGVHVMSFSGENGAFYIDTYTKDLNNYIVYKKSDLSSTRYFNCYVKDTNNKALDAQPSINPSILRASDGNYRVFRLAMACTIEYAAYHVNAAGLNLGTLAQKKAAVLAAMVVTMNRVNGVYERDMSLRMTLIANNDAIIFITSDAFTNDDAYALIDESQAQITSIIGDANFDIGHTVSTGGGGLAGPSPCVSGQKATGITGSPAPVGDAYDIDYVAHEIGHQFGANHTFNNSCGGNRDNAHAVEPGSGTTIMGYAGICPPDIQSNSDSHLHAVSIAEMVALINSSANCAVTTPNGNSAPVITALSNYTIPKGTAYILKSTATDANGDALTYCWEQTDIQISTQPPTQTATGGPNYRSLPPTSASNRYMPTLANVVAGNLIPTWEVTPNVGRNLNFALTVRDNRVPLGGQTSRSNMTVTVNGTAGPFTVTSQNTTGISWIGNSSQTITWNVAGTTANGVNTANVKISLSTDNGLTFPTVLVASTANDGTETIVIPNTITASACRLMIEGIGNIFYAVNSQPFSITSSLSTNNFGLANFVLYPNPNNGNFTVSFASNSSNEIKINVHDLRGRAIYSKSFTNTGLFSQNIQLNKLQTGVYLVTVQDGNQKEVKRIIVK